METQISRPDRRRFLRHAAAATGGLVLGIPVMAEAAGNSKLMVSNVPVRAGEMLPRGSAFGAYLSVRPDGSVLLTSPVIEMGQGAQSSLAALVADEMDVDWEHMAVEEAPVGTPYQRPDITKYQLTSGSWSLRLWYLPMRTAGAAARTMLVLAAAKQWDVDPLSCTTESGRVLHAASGRSLGYGELAAAAALQPVPAKPVLKARQDLRLVGRPVPRTDIPRKVDGSGIYGVDVRLPRMAYAAMRQAPVYGAEVASVDAAALKRQRGIVGVVTVPGAVVVVAETWWQAKKGVERIRGRQQRRPDGPGARKACSGDGGQVPIHGRCGRGARGSGASCLGRLRRAFPAPRADRAHELHRVRERRSV